MQSLNVYLDQDRMGTLTLNEQREFVFLYDSTWIRQPNNVALSISLPLKNIRGDEKSARAFFANLLPEATLRELIAKRLGISERNDFALLVALGGECAGAIRLLPELSNEVDNSTYSPLSIAELTYQLECLPFRPMLVGERGLRLSLAGAQSKLPIYYQDGDFYLPLEGAASSHIIKPLLKHYPESVENELFCMLLAKAVGLPVPTVSYYAEPVKFYLIERYDRIVHAPKQLERIHQEDFCQALSYLPEYKYEAEGGPSFIECYNLIKQNSTKPARDLKLLLEWLIFNYLIGNADGHGKNLAFLLLPEGPILAPFYDLMCTAVYPELNERMAMKIGKENRPAWIYPRHWQRLGQEVGKYAMIKDLQQQLLAQFPAAINQVQKYFAENNISVNILNKIVAIIEKRSGYLQRT